MNGQAPGQAPVPGPRDIFAAVLWEYQDTLGDHLHVLMDAADAYAAAVQAQPYDPNHEPGLSECGCRLCDPARHAVAAQEQPAPGDGAFRADLVDAMLRWSGRDRAGVDECASELAAILDKHPMAKPDAALAALRSGIAGLAAASAPETAEALRRLLETP